MKLKRGGRADASKKARCTPVAQKPVKLLDNGTLIASVPKSLYKLLRYRCLCSRCIN
jgi:hypothetical protein